jgi:hypothetical protein
MEFIKTLTDSFQAIAGNFKDRITNPIGGAFLTSWLIVNWKLVYYFLLNDENVVNKIEFIEKNYSDLTQTICWPVTLTTFYIFIFPTLSNLSLFIWAISDRWSKKLSAKYIEKKIPLYEEDKRNLLALVKKVNAEAKKERTEFLSQIDTLNSALTNFEAMEEESTNKLQRPKVAGMVGDRLLNDKKLSDSEVFSKINTEKGRYLLNAKLAELFHLNVDFAPDKPEIALLSEVFKNVIKAFPSGFTPRNLTINSVQTDINQVNKFLARLNTAGLLVKDSVDTNTFILNEKGSDFSLNIANEI